MLVVSAIATYSSIIQNKYLYYRVGYKKMTLMLTGDHNIHNIII